MNSRTILGLFLTAVALVMLAHWSTRQNRHGRGAAAQRIGTPVLPSLQDADAVNQVVRMVISSPESTFAVARIDGTWKAPDKHGYPVKFESVRSFALALVNMKILQVVPASDASRRRLGLARATDGTAADVPTGTRVILKDKQGTSLADVMIGSVFYGQEDEDSPMAAYGGMPQGRYVAVGDEILIVGAAFSDLPRDAGDWLETDVAHVPSAEILRIRIQQPDRDSLVLERPEPGESLVLSCLGPHEDMNTTKLGSVSAVLSFLRFSDVADPALSENDMGLSKPVAVYTAETSAGVRYRLEVGAPADEQSGRFARLSAALMVGTGADSDGEDEDSEADPSDVAIERETLAAEIEAKQALWSAWTYVLPDHKVNHTLVAREDLVRPKEDDDKPEVPDDKDETARKPGFLGRLFGRD